MAEGLRSSLEHFRSLKAAVIKFTTVSEADSRRKRLVDDLASAVDDISSKLQDESSSEEETRAFAETIKTANKRLSKIKVNLERNQPIPNHYVESLMKLLQDLQSKAFRYTSTTGSGISADSLIRNVEARKFWTDSFPKDIETDWDTWTSKYVTWPGASILSGPEKELLKHLIAFSGGKRVAARLLDNACNHFGFPFQGIKCCKQKNCQCMEFQARQYKLKGKGDSETPLLCIDCNHDKESHLVVECDGTKAIGRGSKTRIAEKTTLIRTESSFTRLQRVILTSDVEVLKSEVNDVADINATDEDGRTALHTAAGYSDNPEAVRMLLENDARWDVFDKSGCAPVHLAARRGQLGIVKVLVEWNKQNADLGTKRPENGFESNKTPLHCAFEEDRLDVIDYLTKGVNVDVNVADHSGENCLFAGVRYDNPESVKLGIEVGADPTHRNSADEAPMDAATVVNSIESMLVLARKEPKTVTAVDDDGNPPLNRCTTVESVDVLVKLGADVNHRNAEGKTALHLTAADPSLVEVSRRLLNNGADADTRDDEDCRPIHAATRMNNEEAVEMLLDEGGADVNAADKHGNTALLLALDGKFESLAEKLLEKGSTVIGTDYNGLTPLHYASQKGYLRLTQRLIDLDAIIEAADAFGKTPLHYAVVEHINVAKELVNLGANMYVRDAKGDTPLGLSRRHGHPLKTLTKEEIELLDFTESSKEDLAIAPGPTFSGKCFADGPGLSEDEHFINTRYSFTVFTCDEQGKLRTEGGDHVKITVKNQESGQPDIVASVSDNSDKRLLVREDGKGNFPVAYEFTAGGRYEFHVEVNEKAAEGSPYFVVLLGTEAPPPPFIEEARYTAAEYSKEDVEFACNEGVGEVDLAIVCDTTTSMSSQIRKAQELMQELVDAVNDEELCTNLRIAIIAYQDHKASKYVTKAWELTSDINAVKKAIDSLSAYGGGDVPEAVACAIRDVCDLNWDEVDRPLAARLAVLIGDAPPHGMTGHDYDDYPDGCPDGNDWLIMAEKCRAKKIPIFTVLCGDDSFAKMAFSSIAESSGGRCTQIGENNSEIINLIKMQAQLLLDKQLTESRISDAIVRLPLLGGYNERLAKVVKEMSNILVRHLSTSGSEASVESYKLTIEDVKSAIVSFKTLSRLASTIRDRRLTDWLGKQLFALKKIFDGSE